MKPTPLLSSVLLTLSLSLSAPAALAHVGHGDEFQAEGGVNRVEVKAETDSLLGIEVNPIEAAADGSGAVLIPVTALVDDNGRQLVFVQYENFYEPVDVTIGSTQGDLIAVTDGLSVGEQLVTQGSLTLYAESRKTQTAEAIPAAVDEAHAQADAEGIPHSHDADGNLVESSETVASNEFVQQADVEAQPSRGFPVVLLVGLGVVAAAGTGTMAVLSSRRKKS
ncbi:cobalt transporter (plasmid) [Nodosilinea sp. E11]|nr:cobalt transporter [Nodosilinea sp. E11]WOD37308.1 cobalt transporter [Nodosilinea sp. E11]